VKIDAKNQRRPIADGEIKTACQQACPAQAIEFGDLSDPKSNVRAAHEADRAYAVLEELNVKPRTRYLAKIRNPNPELQEPEHEHDSGHA
jgi:molybdopterin-containing oxidoreductase family iron-sulfur binding subunit